MGLALRNKLFSERPINERVGILNIGLAKRQGIRRIMS